jgi:hypothetical protein
VNLKHFNANHDLIQGTFFAGSSVAVANWARNFYALHDEMFDKGDFVGKDQTLFNVIAFQRNPESTVKLKTYQNDGCLYNSWFFFQPYFAQDEDYHCPVDRFTLLLE